MPETTTSSSEAPRLLAGRYRLEAPLGSGGAATAFVATDQRSRAPVAVKLLRRRASGALVEAFESEFERLRGLHHPRVVTVHDYGVGRDAVGPPRPFYVAELVMGEPLSLHAPGRTWEALSVPFADALEGLRFLHRAGLAHGDVKPDNIVVDDSGRGVLIDLGCSRSLDAPPADRVSGTDGFMAPELLDGTGADARADLYSAGVTLHELLAHASGAVPERVRALADRLVAPDPASRPTDATEVLEELGRRSSELGPPGGRARRLVGRDEVLETFEAMLDDLVQGRPGPRVLWLHGPEGAGKTRVLRELKWRAQIRCPALEGWVDDADGPLGAVVRFLERDPSRGVEAALDACRDMGRRGAWVLLLDDAHLAAGGARTVVDALLRTTSRSAGLVWVCAGREPAPVESDAAVDVRLAPLTRADVRRWAGDTLTEREAAALHEASGGHPAVVESALAALALGRVTGGSIARAARDAAQGPDWLASTLGDDEGALAAAAALVAGGGRLADATARALEVPAVALGRLSGAGAVERVPGAWSLRPPASAPAVERLLVARDDGRRALADAHASLLRLLERGDDAARGSLAERVRLVAGAGRPSDAARLLADADDVAAEAPALQRLLDRDEGLAAAVVAIPAAALTAARVEQLAGEPRRALRWLGALLRTRPAPPIRVALRTEAGRVYLRLGDPRRAERHLELALAEAGTDEERARAVDVLSRVRIQQGRWEEARRLAREAVGLVQSAELASALHEDLGVAAAYLGALEEAEHELARARELASDAQPRQLVRWSSYLGIAAFRAGDTTRAADRYAEALAVAEQHGLDDQVATAALNHGTAHQLSGDWGAALASYERALRIAHAIGKRSTEVTLRYNLSNLFVLIGAFERAQTALDDIDALAQEEGLAYFTGACAGLRGEIALHEGRLPEAEESSRRALTEAEARRALREGAEHRLLLSATALARGDRESALDFACRALDAAKEIHATDVHARSLVMRARIEAAEGSASTALPLLEQARALAERSGELLLRGEVDGELSRVAAAGGATELAASHRSRARATLERIALSLPRELRDRFWRHPARADLAEAPRAGNPPSQPHLERLLDINHRLGAARSVQEVVDRALDAAIELSGAERGFVLLERDGRLAVETARNLDRERIGRSHLKFSRGIAERVVEAGEPVVTVDAQQDQRFRSNRSVHAMRLTSVACVPIGPPDDVLGAIYLDNRFRRGRFGERDVWILVAFADQVAIALRNARLHEQLAARTRELEERTEELERERERVEELLREQERDIDRLTEESRARQRALAHRYDYSRIVGSGPAMRRVFELLDRIIEAPVDVLIEGESGTGKELVARAIHFNGPRAEGPFVAVNCAALPDALLESELFGHVRGAYTGADRDRTGLLVSADGGTVFLDEVGETSAAMQAKLLRVIQERRVRPVGSTADVPVDVRVVSATNRTLLDEVRGGRFREDLYYRLAVITVRLPALRDRAEDLPELCRRILEDTAGEHGRQAPAIARAALRELAAHRWPGNVRELENVLRRALLTAGDIVGPSDLELGSRRPEPEPSTPPADRGAFRREEAARIRAALADTGWNVSAVSRRLGIPRNTLYRRMKRYGIQRA